MSIKNRWNQLNKRLQTQWLACKVISNNQSVRYGIRFSYPIYIAIVIFGVLSQNPYTLSVAALIALLGMILPLHPFDYVYNYIFSKLMATNTISGRGSELQINSTVALVFTLLVIALIFFKIPLNYPLLASIYLFSSIFFLSLFIINKNPRAIK